MDVDESETPFSGNKKHLKIKYEMYTFKKKKKNETPRGHITRFIAVCFFTRRYKIIIYSTYIYIYISIKNENYKFKRSRIYENKVQHTY